MSKELFVSSTPHETKVAVVEDDQLAEIYFERENEYTLAGSIYKGRVTRVLPGMQSAFVDIGLERDAFLYVTDFLEEQEDQEEFERVVTEAHDQATRGQRPGETVAPLPPPARPPEPRAEPRVQPAAETRGPEQPASTERNGVSREREEGGRGWRRGRRRRGGRGRGFPESKFAREGPPREAPPREEPAERPRPSYGPPPGYTPIILPGESISKYAHLGPAAAEPEREGAQLAAATEPLPTTLERQLEEEASRLATAWTAEQEPETEVQPSPRRDTEEIDVPAVLAAEAERQRRDEEGQRTEQQEAPEHLASASGAIETEESQPSWRSERRTPARPSYAAAPGVIEEEEIEDEEAELPAMGEAGEENDFEELEEETLQREGEPGASSPFGGAAPEISEVVENHLVEETAEAGEYGEDEEEEGGEEEEFEQDETEVMGERAESGAQSGEARAELRGPAGTAGYQQRAQRPERDDARRRGRRGGRRMRRAVQRHSPPPINELLREGQEILVQIAKEPIGKKGARITSHVALPGRFLVFMPTVNHIGVSRKISSDEERQRLKRVIQGEHGGPGGFIVRTAAAGASDEDLRADVRFLLNLWAEIRQRAEHSKAPALIYHDLNLVERMLRDQVTANFTQIWVDSEEEYQRVLRFVSRFQSTLVKRVKLYTKDTPLFEQFNIQQELDKALKSKVWLKSGGYIVINQTEALVAIDVNTGKYVGKTQRLEDTIVKTNVDAIKEIVRQVRLRDLGGIIVIDFIDMDERKNRTRVMQALDEELRKDRSPSKVLAFNDFGLVAITRKRVKQSLERTLGSPCPYCTGTGLVKSVATICNEIYVEMRKASRQLEKGDVVLRVNPEVAKALKANSGRWLSELEELTGRTVILKSDPQVHQEQFDIN